MKSSRQIISNSARTSSHENSFKWARTDGLKQGRAEGEAKGRLEGRAETAQNLIRMGLDLDKIAQATELSLEEIKKIKASMSD